MYQIEISRNEEVTIINVDTFSHLFTSLRKVFKALKQTAGKLNYNCFLYKDGYQVRFDGKDFCTVKIKGDKPVPHLLNAT